MHNVEVSVSEVNSWVDKEGKRGELKVDFSDKDPPEDFSGFISIDGTFKAVTTKKNDPKTSKNKKKEK